jgi:biopolymer transport protein ExbD
MQVDRPESVQCRINVTPLVDVVLVLLIIFMVVAPHLQAGPPLNLPTTDRPPDKPENGRQIQVAIEQDGVIWIDAERVAPEQFSETIRRAAQKRGDWQVVIKGDARLTFGEVQRAMFAVEGAGFSNVGLIAERQDDSQRRN